MPSLAPLALRLAIVVAMVGAGWWFGGPSSALIAAGLGAIFIAKPLLDLASDLRHAMRGAAFRAVEGRHYAWRGRRFEVIEDEHYRRWLRIAELRSAAGLLTSDGALALSYPSGFRRVGHEAWLSEEAALAHLARERGDEAHRLRRWIERDIALPARRTRERLGIRVPPPDAPADN